MTMKLCSECGERIIGERAKSCNRCAQRRKPYFCKAGVPSPKQPPAKVTDADLREAYLDQGRSLQSIADKASDAIGERFSVNQVAGWLDFYGIPRRNHAEAQQLRQERQKQEKAAQRG